MIVRTNLEPEVGDIVWVHDMPGEVHGFVVTMLDDTEVEGQIGFYCRRAAGISSAFWFEKSRIMFYSHRAAA